MPIQDVLANFGIEIKSITKTNAIIRLKNASEDVKLSKLLFEKLNAAVDNNVNVTKHIKLPNITFGVEFEFIGSSTYLDKSAFDIAMFKLIGEKYINAGKYAHNDGTYWILGKDSSIHYDSSVIEHPTGYELSTPALNFNNPADLNLFKQVIVLIKKHLKGYVNTTCGTHIHLGFTRDKLFKDNIKSVLITYSNIESKVFDPIVPSSRRRNRYCKKTTDSIPGKYQKVSSRYCKFDSYNECKCLHFEFRQLEGTLDENLILNWLHLHALIMFDLINNSNNETYLNNLSNKNIFDLLFYYGFDSDIISFFIDRVIKFKSKTIQQS